MLDDYLLSKITIVQRIQFRKIFQKRPRLG